MLQCGFIPTEQYVKYSSSEYTEDTSIINSIDENKNHLLKNKDPVKLNASRMLGLYSHVNRTIIQPI